MGDVHVAVAIACPENVKLINCDSGELIWSLPYPNVCDVSYSVERNEIWVLSRDGLHSMLSPGGHRPIELVSVAEGAMQGILNCQVNSHGKIVATFEDSTSPGIHLFSENGELDNTMQLKTDPPTALVILPPWDNIVVTTYISTRASLCCFSRAGGNQLWHMPLIMSVGDGRHCRPTSICQDPVTKKLLIADANQDAIWAVNVSGSSPILDPESPILDYRDQICAPTSLVCSEKILLVGLSDGQLIVFKR